jgi:hypothetical protein
MAAASGGAGLLQPTPINTAGVAAATAQRRAARRKTQASNSSIDRGRPADRARETDCTPAFVLQFEAQRSWLDVRPSRGKKEVFVRLLAAVLMLACLALLAVPAQAAEVTRTLDASLPVSPGAPFAVLNLAGTLTVVPAPGPAVRVKATVHAESDDLAASVSLATVTGKDGTPTLRVEYPVDRHEEFRYPPRGAGSDSGFDYAGRRVRVSGSRGILLYADLVVEVPVGAGKGRLETHAGAIQADHMDGSLRFETGSGSIQISHSKGDLVGDTGSGDVVAQDVHG